MIGAKAQEKRRANAAGNHPINGIRGEYWKGSVPRMIRLTMSTTAAPTPSPNGYPAAPVPAHQHGVTVNAPITINGAATEHTNLSAILAEHAWAIAYEVQRLLQMEYEQAAVV